MLRHAILCSVTFLAFFIAGCGKRQPEVVLYTSQDQVFAEPILKKFTEQTGIKVQTVFDSEAVKTVGLANRLLAEAKHPRCDVWWSNEEMRTAQLAARDVFDETHGFIAFGYRSRRLVVNTNLVPLSNAPALLVELTNAQWHGKVALAYPMFGSTSAHFVALRDFWGARPWEVWCRALAANKPFLVDGNSVVVKLVGRGEAAIGLTDSDDIMAGQREGMPIAAAALTPEFLLIPNTTAIIRGAPHREAALELFTYLQSAAVSDALVAAGALEGAAARPALSLTVGWHQVVADIDPATEKMKQIFLR